ncbi:MAG: maleylpyruvate isomerase N-terminal domain-containing protein [Frankiaceae bacterium]
MDLWSAPVRDVRPLAREERADLVVLVDGLTADEWLAPSAAPGWRVKELALHVLQDDLWWLSTHRDCDRAGILDMSDRDRFVRLLAERNQEWVDGARALSGRVITDLLAWSGEQLDRHHVECDLSTEGWVSWASDGPVPLWFNLAQELTERWVHQQQMREAVGRVEDHGRYLPDVLRIFVWALPHQCRVPAEAGAQVAVDLGSGGSWHLVSDGAGRWALEEGATERPRASLVCTETAAWRWLTGGAVPDGEWRVEGPGELVEPLRTVRAAIV